MLVGGDPDCEVAVPARYSAFGQPNDAWHNFYHAVRKARERVMVGWHRSILLRNRFDRLHCQLDTDGVRSPSISLQDCIRNEYVLLCTTAMYYYYVLLLMYILLYYYIRLPPLLTTTTTTITTTTMYCVLLHMYYYYVLLLCTTTMYYYICTTTYHCCYSCSWSLILDPWVRSHFGFPEKEKAALERATEWLSGLGSNFQGANG